jgi:tRNA(adenine34) deaminase
LSEHDDTYMNVCLDLARQAAAAGDVPVGAVVVIDGQIIGRGFNVREGCADPTGHAEIIALRQAAEHLGHWRVLDSTLYVTLEPCAMCAGALVNARVSRLVYGCLDPKAGAVDSLFSIPTDARLNHRLVVQGGVRADECSELLSGFFQERRRIKDEAKVKMKMRRGGRAAEGA